MFDISYDKKERNSMQIWYSKNFQTTKKKRKKKQKLYFGEIYMQFSKCK